MNSFELNKLLGAVLGTFLGVLAVHLAAGAIYSPRTPAKPGFVIAVNQTPPSSQPAAPKPEESIATLLASASVDRGKADAKVCSTCHDFDKGGPNKIGPNLWGVVDRPRASEPGYDYSSAMKAKGGKWTFDELDKFLTHPQGYIPGTKMTFTGFSRAPQRADVIAYLRTLSDNPVPLPPAPTAQQGGQAANQGSGSAPKQQSQQQQSQTSAAPAGAQADPPGQPTAAQNSGEAAKPPQSSLAKLVANASVDRGKADTKVCSVCHNFNKGGPNMIGPNLWGVVGRPRASEPGYDYSSAMKAKGGKWTIDELDKFLTHPQGYIPGTKMTFAGFDRPGQRADVIAYLRTLSDNPQPLPTTTGSSAAHK